MILKQFFAALLSLSTTRALQYFQLLRQGSVLLVSVILAKSGLSTADIGAYEMLFYLGTVLSFFWINGLLQGITPVFSNLEEKERSGFFFNNFLVFAALGLGVGLLLYLGSPWLLPALLGKSELPYFELYCLYLTLHIPSFPVEYIYLLRKKPGAIVAWGVFSFGLFLLAVGLPLWLEMGLEFSFKFLIVLAALRLAWTLWLVIKESTWTWNPDLLKRYLRFSGPLMGNVLVGNFILLFDAWLVAWWYKDEAVFAVFRYGARELPLAQALAGALGVAIIPRLTENWTAGLSELKQMSTRLFHLLFPITALLIVLSPYLFPVVFNPEFMESVPVFQIYLLLTFSRVLLPNSLVLAKGHPGVIFQVGLMELGVKVLLGFLGIYYGGLVGLAWSAVAAFWFEKIALMAYLVFTHQVRISEWLHERIYLAYLLLTLLVFFLSTH